GRNPGFSWAQLTNSTFTNNSALVGGGLYVANQTGVPATLSGTTFSFNQGYNPTGGNVTAGGAIGLHQAGLALNGNTFTPSSNSPNDIADDSYVSNVPGQCHNPASAGAPAPS